MGAQIVEEQAALRRVAVLVARAAPPEKVFAAITEEAGRLLSAGHAVLSRYDSDGAMSVVATWSSAGAAIPVGTRVSGEMARLTRELGLSEAVGAPVSTEGRLWGAVIVAPVHERPLPADTETRLAAFTALAATAIGNAQAREELRGFAEEQAALSRVATLVAQGSPAHEVFITVAEEAGQLLRVDCTVLSRYDPDGLVTVIGGWTATDPGRPLDVGLRLNPEGRNIHALVFETGQSARIDDYDAASGGFGNLARSWKFRASVGVPIRVEGRLWGVISAVSRSAPLPADAEERLAGFTELAAAALANSDAQAALTASRARIVAATDQTRRRVERDLHDGAQQRLVSLALHLRAAQSTVPPGAEWLAEQLEGAVGTAADVQEQLREISHGLHPAVLTEDGLRPALRALARRSAVPVNVHVQLAGRLAEPIEMAAYYAVSEALTNTTRHARASAAQVEVAADESVLRVLVRDDGCGGADFGSGSGLTGLKDRVEAFGGWISLRSPPGAGTTLEIALPLHDPAGTVGHSRANSGS